MDNRLSLSKILLGFFYAGSLAYELCTIQSLKAQSLKAEPEVRVEEKDSVHLPITRLNLGGRSHNLGWGRSQLHQLQLTKQVDLTTMESQPEFIERLVQVTVRVVGKNSQGSGVLLSGSNDGYLVVTNKHVLQDGDSLQVMTYDQHYYAIESDHIWISERYDLAFLQFSTPSTYPTAQVNASPQNTGSLIYTIGFPATLSVQATDPLWLTQGQITLQADQPLLGGYQLGHNSSLRKGMSGGAVVNAEGELIGINGRHAYPLWGDPYQYQDGSPPPCPTLKAIMQQSHWAIPMSIVLAETRTLVDEIPKKMISLEKRAINRIPDSFSGSMPVTPEDLKETDIGLLYPVKQTLTDQFCPNRP